MKTPELILWEDHHEPNKDTWDEPTPAAELGPIIAHTVGFVMSENDVMIEVARDYYEADGMSAGAFFQIMKKCIVARHKLAPV